MEITLSPAEERGAMMKLLRLLLAPPESNEVEWLNATAETLASNPDTLAISRTYNVPVASRLIVMLRDCLLAHRWKDAVRLLMSVVKRPSLKKGHLVLNVALELFHKLSEYNEIARLNNLYFNLKFYAELTEKEVCIQFFLFHAVHDRFIEASSSMKLSETRRRTETSFAVNLEYHQRLYKAYNGLNLWVQVKNLTAPNSEGTSMVHVGSIIDLAIDEFEDLENVPGVWDVFISKYVELLEGQNKRKVAQEVLRGYQNTNSSNPNAWKFLYYFYKRHGDDNLAFNALQELAGLVPSDALTLELYKFSVNGMIHQSDKPGFDRIALLFDLLDHANWRNVEKPWKMLSRDLVASYGSESEEVRIECHSSLQKCWTLRSDWWPQYHFRDSKPPEGCERTDRVRVYKAVVARFLLGKKNKYTRTVFHARSSNSRKCYDLLERAINTSCTALISNDF